MTIDERIDKLTERHEALSQTVELLVAQGVETRKMLEETRKMVDETRKMVDETTKMVEDTSASVKEVSKTVDVLARSIYEMVGAIRQHETRIVRLEDRAA